MSSQREFDGLVDQFYPRIRRAALVMTGSGWDADDLAQETFVQALKGIDRFRGDSSIETWLYAILINQERKWRRSKGRQGKLKEIWNDLWRRQPDHPATDEVEAKEWFATIWKHVAELPEAQRHAMILRYSEDLPVQEIADVCNCPAGTSKSRLHHGLKSLKEKCRGMQSGQFTSNLSDLQRQTVESPA